MTVDETAAPAPASPPPLPPRASPRPLPLGSLIASARRLTTKTMSRAGFGSSAAGKSWQDDAWEMYDLVGEQRFLAATLAGRLAQAHFYVGKVTDDPTEPPQPVTGDDNITSVLDAFGSSAAARSQMILRLGINLFVAGDGWLVGIPRGLFPSSLLPASTLNPDPDANDNSTRSPIYVQPSTVRAPDAASPLAPVDQDQEGDPFAIDGQNIEDLEWRMLSVSEVSARSGQEVTLHLGDAEGEKLICSPDDVFLIRVWRPHPRRSWEADSPTRSSLPVLREIVGLTMHISAQVDSRLAGAGLLIIPQSAQRALKVAAGTDGTDAEGDTDEFTEALMEAMIKPVSDRANASALVPLVVTVPDEVTDNFNYLTFAKPLDQEARALRDEAIRRLALGQDAPPELLLGVSGMNHWGAWLVREDVVTTHIEPPLALICDAITTQYLWPVLADLGIAEERAHEFVVWYDVSHMIMRPNRAADAMILHERGVISDESLRDATGFGDSDAPETTDANLDLDTESTLALEIAQANPTLFNAPGLPKLVAQIKAVVAGEIPEIGMEALPPALQDQPPPPPPADGQDQAAPPPPPQDGPPSQIPSASPAEVQVAASAAVKESWDGVRRASTTFGNGTGAKTQTFALETQSRQAQLPFLGDHECTPLCIGDSHFIRAT